MHAVREKRIAAFAKLGRVLSGFGRDDASRRAVSMAVQANPWFTPDDIFRAVSAIRGEMLDEAKLTAWAERYPAARPVPVGVIMAGNIPLVGFFDMLCVLIAGCELLYKPSSKDSVLIDYIVSLLHAIDPGTPAAEMADRPPRALLAMGSNNTRRQLEADYRGIPTLIRGDRSSAAVLDGSETAGNLKALAGDIFSYSGLGCRNVSHIFIPRGYDVAALRNALTAFEGDINPKYLNNYRQRKALLEVQGGKFLDGGFFLLRESGDFPVYLSEITYRHYGSMEEVREWLGTHDHEIQCVAGTCPGHPRSVALGLTQNPRLSDYPDSRDTMAFLVSLR